MEVTANKLELISQGANSRIYLYGEGESKVVLKMVKASAYKQSQHLSNQYKILKQLDHQNIIMSLKFKANVQVSGFSQFLKDRQEQNDAKLEQKLEERTQQLCVPNIENVLILEHAKFGSFLDLIKKVKLEVGQIRQLFIQASEALEYLHCKYIVHRDIKLDNILVTTNGEMLVVKIADFGFAKSCFNPDTNSLVQFNSFKGTKRGYMAPEIHSALKNPENFYDGTKSDIFALGVVLFAAILGSLPFEHATKQNRLYKLIAQEKYEQFWKNHDKILTKFQGIQREMLQEFKNLFIGMVHADPKKRFSIEDVLESEWAQGQRITTQPDFV